jgi:diguanylate cyclase (GGDEF)-like protein
VPITELGRFPTPSFMSDTHGIPRRLSRSALLVLRFKLSRMHVLVLLSILLMVALQRVGFAILGSRPVAMVFIDALAIFTNCLAIGSSIAAYRKSRGVARTFWLLFGSALTFQLTGNVGWAYIHYFHVAVSENALFPSLFYRFSAGPMAIALFLSDESHTPRLESFLDRCMVVGLVGLTTYQVQMAELDAHDPKIWQLITIGTMVNVVLAAVAAIRFRLAAPGCLHGLFARQTIYLAIYLCVSFITSFADAYLPKIETSVDLLWIVTYLSAAALAATWRPPQAQERPPTRQISRRTSLLCFNLTLAIMVLGSAALGLRLVNATRVVGLAAVSIVLFSFAVRSALMQDSQEKYLEELRESRAQLERQALYDELTGLPNRRLLADRLAQVLAIAQRERQIVALLCLDLDGFKPVNDLMGHWMGDLLLKQVAIRMLSRVRISDTLARMGGDEFIWLVVNLSGKEQAARLAEQMLQTLSEAFEIEGHTIQITASIGIGLFPEGATDADSLMQQADSAMYSVKRDGKNGVRYYSPELSFL